MADMQADVDIMALLKKKKPKVEIEMEDAEEAGEDVADSTEAPPMAAPMSTDEPKMGNVAAAQINVQMAMDLLRQTVPMFGSGSEEGKMILGLLSKLAGKFGEREAKTRELVPAEILQMIQTLPQAGGATPEQRIAASAPVPGMETPPAPM